MARAGPKSPDNRTLTANLVDDVSVDPEFSGLTGCPPLGIDPFAFKPGLLGIKVQRLEPAARHALGGAGRAAF